MSRRLFWVELVDFEFWGFKVEPEEERRHKAARCMMLSKLPQLRGARLWCKGTCHASQRTHFVFLCFLVKSSEPIVVVDVNSACMHQHINANAVLER
jgi:hypothetical protein